MKTETNDKIIVEHLKKEGLYGTMEDHMKEPDNSFITFIGRDMYVYFATPNDGGWIWLHAESLEDVLSFPVIVAKFGLEAVEVTKVGFVEIS